jgi:hypothetical protein
MSKRYLIFFLLLGSFLIRPASAGAQQRWLEATAGGAVSFATVKGSDWKYGARILPHAGVSGFVCFNERLALKSGLLYQMKGMETRADYEPDSVFRTQSFVSRNDYHFLSIPLQLAYTFGKHKRDQYRVAAGMSYGFMMKANSTISIDSYYDDGTKEATSYNYTHLVTGEQKESIEWLPQEEGAPVAIFTPALRMDFTYQFEEKLLLTIFYEYNLQDVRTRTVSSSQARLHYTGISLGVRIW